MRRFLLIIFILSFNFTYAQAPINGLVAYYPFNGNANDDVGTNNGTVNGSILTFDRKGVSNSAYQFNGTDSYIQVPHSSALNITGAITLSVWFNTSNVNLSQRIIDKTTVSGSDAYMIDLRPSQQIRFIVANAGSNGQTQAQSNAVFTQNNEWYHFVVTYDNNSVKFFKNGILINSTVQTGSSINNTNPLRFGANSLLDNDWFTGKLDDIRIYNRALSDTEVQDIYQAEAPPIDITTGLVARYKMDGNAQDSSGNSNHGTAQNGVTFGMDRFGNAGKAASFDGVDDRIDLNYTFGPYQEMTVSAWVNINQTSNELQAILSPIDQKLVHFQLGNTGGNTVFYVDNTNTFLPNITQSPLNIWRQVTIISKSGASKIYENGVLIGSSSQTYSQITATNLLLIGSGFQNGRFLNGKIDDVRIYNRALTNTEVQALYQAETPPIDITTGLVAQYNMDGNAQDASGNSNHGTAQNGVTFGTDRFGNAGKAASFDGTTGEIVVNKNLGPYRELTITAWVKNIQTNSGIQAIVSSTNQTFSHFQMSDNSEVRNVIYSGVGGFGAQLSVIPVLPLNTWNFYSVRYKSGQSKLYKNGLEIEVSNESFSDIIETNLIKIGNGFNNSRFLNGLIDDVRIYNRALSDAEVLALYNLENNASLTNVKIEPLLELINQTSYEVTKEATVHHYFLAKDNTTNVKLKDVVLTYQIGIDPTVRYSTPSDTSGLIDLNLTVGGADPNNSNDDWIAVSSSYVPVQSLGIATGTITGTNAFANNPFNIRVIDKAEPTDKEMGMAFGVKINVNGTDQEVPKPLGSKAFKTFSRSAAIGITIGPQFTFKAINANEWDITAGASIGAFAEFEADAKFSLGKPTLKILGEGSIGLDTKADLKVRLNLDDAKQCFKFAKSLFEIFPKSTAEFLKLSSFFENAINLGTTPTNPFTFKGNTIGSAISADGGISVSLSAPETSIYNFKGYGNILKVTPSLSFSAEASFTSEMSNTFDVDEGLSFNNSISAGAEMNVNLEALSRLSSRGSSSRFSIENLPFKIYSNSIYNTFALTNKFDLGNNPTGSVISLSSQKKESIVGQSNEFLKTNYVNNWEYGQRANEKVYAVSFSGGVLENNRVASFISKNQTLLGSLWKDPDNNESYYNSILTLNEYVLKNAASDWTIDEININSQREISYQKEGGIEIEIPLLKTDLGEFNYTSWNTYTHDFEKSRFSKSLNRILPTISLPDITSNLILPEQDLLSLLWTKLKAHVENLGTELVNQAFGFVTEQFYTFIDSVTTLTNGVFGSSNTFIRKSLSGEIIYDKNSKDKALTTNVPSVFTFTINPSPQVFTSTTSLKFSYFYPENQLNAVTAIDTFRIISDVFYVNATDGTTPVNIAPNGNFNINTNFSPNDLALASLPSNMIPRIMYKPNNSYTWEDIGAVNQNISFNKLGTFGIGVKISNDFIPPVISAVIPSIFTSPNSVIFDLSDNKSGIDWQKTKIWVNGTLINYTRVSNTNQINIPISSLPTNAQNTFLVQMVTYDLAGNQQLYNRLLPCNYSVTINSLLDRIGTPITEQATTKIEINAKVPTDKDLHLKAGQNITLTPGFEMKNGKVFKAEIGGCNN